MTKHLYSGYENLQIEKKTPMTIDDLTNKLADNGLAAYIDKLTPFLRNTIRLYSTSADDDQIRIGQTKIGGRPDLPPNFSWVKETNKIITNEKKFLTLKNKKEETVTKSLSFIAQINLAEITNFDKENLLSKQDFYTSFILLNRKPGDLIITTKINSKFFILTET